MRRRGTVRGLRINVTLGLVSLVLIGAWEGGCGAGAFAQAAAQTAMEGSVTGRVMCSDTQAPARFAEVTLTPVAETTGGGGYGGFEERGRRVSTRTDLDGQYVATEVPPGDYYVTASATGYISEQAALQEGIDRGTDVQTLLAQLPVVHVSAGASSTASVTLDRGATIAGKVLWDDGSPAAGVPVRAIGVPAAQSVSGAAPSSTQTATQSEQNSAVRAFGGGFGGGGGGSGFDMTDDRGTYRLTGLAAGDYVVRVDMPLPVQRGRGGFGGGYGGASISVYAPGKMRKTDAKPLTLHAGEEEDGIGVTLDLAALHTVSGVVSSASDAAAVGSGTVLITDQTDSTLTRSATIAPDGSFKLTYVPSGTYTLAVPYASTSSVTSFMGRRRRGSNGGSGGFQPLTQTLSVTDSDVSGLELALTPATSSTQH